MIDTDKLRCSIIRLALSGQLTRKNTTDSSVDQLLHSVNSKKNIRQTGKVPYDIPSYWAWAKLEDLYEINPKVVADDNTEAAFIPMEKIEQGFNNGFTYDIQPWIRASKNHTRFENGDVAFAKISPCFENRKSFIAEGLPNGIGGGTTELIILRQPAMCKEYTFLLVLDQRFIHEGSSSYKGIVGQQRVKTTVIKNYLVPVPPIEEQERIITKVKNLFNAIEVIDEAQTRYRTNAEVLKSKVIDAGIRGKLTTQLPGDGNAEDLYQQIQTEKAKLVKEGKIKKSKPLPPIKPEEIPFEIPKNWKWVRFENISYIVRGGSPRPIKRYITNDENGINWIKIGDVEKGGKYIFSTKEKIIPEGEKKSRHVYPGDFLLTNSMSFGRPYISKIEGCIHDGWLLIRNLGGFNVDYLYYLLSSGFLYGQFTEKASGSTVDNLNIEKVNSSIIPLPPLSEQERIADKISEILNDI